MSVKDKLKDKTLLRRAGILIGKIAAFYLLVFIVLSIFLRIYTHHAQSISVPDFKGVMPARAMQIAKSNNLRLNIIDSTFIDYLPKGCIVDQNPRPGTHVKRDRTIFLTTNAFHRARVEMPKLVGLSYRQGKATLEMHGLRIGRLIYKPDFAKNNILNQMHNGQTIEAGTMIERGESIDIVLGDGYSSNTTPLPDLTGMTCYEAINELNNAYLNVGKITYNNAMNASDTLNARVYKQNPAYSGFSSRAMPGSRIDIWLSIDNPTTIESINLNE